MHVDLINQQLEERSGDSLSLQNQMTVTHSAVFDTITQTAFETVICELPYEKLLEAFENPSVQISSLFLKDIVARFSSYYARQGQPDIDYEKVQIVVD